MDIKTWFVGIEIGIGINMMLELESGSKTLREHWNRNPNRNHLLLESELESESWILENPGIGIRIGINSWGNGIRIGITGPGIIYQCLLKTGTAIPWNYVPSNGIQFVLKFGVD